MSDIPTGSTHVTLNSPEIFGHLAYDVTNDVITCPTPGYYEFTLALQSNAGNPVSVSIYRNEQPLAGAYAAYSGDVNTAVASVIALCSSGDEFQLRCDVSHQCTIDSATAFQAVLLGGSGRLKTLTLSFFNN